jgi:hypothetical protein
VWSDYASSVSSPLAEASPLPFKLYEKSSATPGYMLTTVLPVIGIERACYEPYNETASTITGTSRFYNASIGAANCTHVKPMYWQSPVQADFDGDRREDIVVFRPQGTSTTWGAKADKSEVDFVVFYSGSGYSQVGGRGYFNLATLPGSATAGVTPNDIPIVADYDRDGLADYGVFDPRTGDYRIAFSLSNYLVIGSGNMGVSDPSGQQGLIAVPGHYTSTTNLQLLVVRTASTTAAGRYDMFISNVINPTFEQLMDDDLTYSLPAGHAVSGNEVSSANLYKVKPAPGTVSVPAFADYDDDGITELGWLSWYGGNMAQQIAGRVIGQRSATLAKFFETDSNPDTTPMNTRMNPYDMDFDSAGNLLYTDPIDGRLWKLDADALGGISTPDTSSSHMIMPTADYQAARTLVPNPEAKFAPENVYDVTRDNRALNPADTDAPVTASERQLRTPRKFFVATDYDKALYIADHRNMRILRLESGESGIDSTSTSSVILGSSSCTSGGCSDLVDDKSPSLYSIWGDANGQYTINPSAIELVPDTENKNRYFVAFSSGNAVYLITHENEEGGPLGTDSDRIWKVAGKHSTAPSYTAGDTNAKYTDDLIADQARNSALCPIIDLKYHSGIGGGVLLMAASCSLPRMHGETGLTFQSVGGIYTLTPAFNSDKVYRFHDPLAEDLDNSIALSVGTMWVYPCTQGVCAGPQASGAGNYQRKINVMANANAIDLVNPVDMEVGPRGEVYFIDQWNEDTIYDTERFPESPNVQDRLHRNGVWIWDAATNTNSILPFTNNFFYSDGLLPVWGPDWYSPTRLGDTASIQWNILAHKAPLKNVPVPATAGITISGNTVYTSVPFVRPPSDYSESHPLYTEPKQLGMIYSIELDRDGDGTPDSADTDLDGDGVLNTLDTSPRSMHCPEIYGTTNSGACRAQEELGIPRQTFFKITGADIAFDASEAGAPTGRNYGEFLFVNSVAECGPEADCASESLGFTAAQVKPEVWATLFNWGDDFDFGGTDACTSDNSVSTTSPYYGCIETSNGPIAMPQPLHAMVGWDVPILTYTFESFPGGGHLNSTTPGTERRPDSNLFKFPFILSSLRPKENGIKSPKRVPLYDVKDPRITKSGLLCRDYEGEIYTTGPGPAAAAPFKLNFDNYLGNYFYSGFDPHLDSTLDNDFANYAVDCAYDQTASFPGTDARKQAVEGIVLQLDHDDTDGKEGGVSGQWPYQWAAGIPADPENINHFLFIDHDGNGVRNPSYLIPPQASGDSAFSGASMANPFMVVGLGLQNSDDKYDSRTINYIDKLREPFNSVNLWNNLGYGSDYLMTGPFARINAVTQDSINLLFDKGWAGTNLRDNALFVALDFEPFIPKDFEIGSRQDAGAGLFTNYTKSTRFRRNADDDIPSALVAARNVLKIAYGVGDAEFTSDEADFASDEDIKAYINLSKDGAACTGDLNSSAALNCDSVEVRYKSSYLGFDIVVSSKVPLNQGYLRNYQEVCDPNGGPEGFDCN